MSSTPSIKVAPLDVIAEDEIHVITMVPVEFRTGRTSLADSDSFLSGGLNDIEWDMGNALLLKVLRSARIGNQLILLHAGPRRWLWMKEVYCRLLTRFESHPADMIAAVPTSEDTPSP